MAAHWELKLAAMKAGLSVQQKDYMTAGQMVERKADKSVVYWAVSSDTRMAGLRAALWAEWTAVPWEWTTAVMTDRWSVAQWAAR
jgi:hypothetical protein